MPNLLALSQGPWALVCCFRVWFLLSLPTSGPNCHAVQFSHLCGKAPGLGCALSELHAQAHLQFLVPFRLGVHGSGLICSPSSHSTKLLELEPAIVQAGCVQTCPPTALPRVFIRPAIPEQGTGPAILGPSSSRCFSGR